MRFSFFILLFSILLACNNSEDKRREAATEIILKGNAQGTTYTIKYIADEYKGIQPSIDSLLRQIDMSLSTYIPESKISRLNEGDTIILDQLFLEVFNLSRKIHKITNGAFDPTIGPLIKAWGWDYSKPEQMDAIKITHLLAAKGFDKFTIQQDKIWKTHPLARLNFNAIAQGYAVDLMAEKLYASGIKNYYVELGGELIVRGKNKYGEDWIIGIDSPKGENLERVINRRVSLKNKALVTSGNYRKFYEIDGKKYSHTLNPKTGYPSKNTLLSVSVIAEDAATADAFATAFMVKGLKETKLFLDSNKMVDAYLIYTDGGKFKNFATQAFKANFLED